MDDTASDDTAAPQSLFAFQFPSDPQLSPDGTQVAFVMTRIAEQRGEPDVNGLPRPRYFSRIQHSSGGPARDLSSGEHRDTAPLWSPDGQTLVFSSDRPTSGNASGPAQLYALPLRGGEARQLTHFKTGADTAAFSSDGRYLSFLSQGDDLDQRDERGEARAVTSLSYRHNGRGMVAPQPASLYLHDLSSGQTRLWLSPPFTVAEYVWKPDASGVLLVGSPTEGGASGGTRQEVYALELPGPDTSSTPPTPTSLRQLTTWAAPIGNLAPHPNGLRFAATGRPPGSRSTDDPHLFLFGEHGQGQRLDSDWDYPAGNFVAGDLHVGSFPAAPVWKDATTLSLLYTVGGSVGLFDVSLPGAELDGQPSSQVRPRLHDAQGVVSSFTARGEHLAHIFETATRPTEVYLNGVAVTDGAAKLPFVPLTPQRISFGDDLGEGWVLLPVGEHPVPALLNIHGGPHTAYGHGFMHEFQLFAQHGYGVCYSNPRGSVGYGQRWSDANRGDWGGADQHDLLDFFDTCLTTFPRLDASRTGVMGGSYGGFMTNWITSHTDRFNVAVTDRSICNLVSFGGVSDIGMWFWDDELGLNFQRREQVHRLLDMSPLTYVEAVTTPTLIIHSLEDLRCPIDQAEQWFAALQLHNVPSRFVRFPNENHELSRSGRPDRRVRRLQEYLDWLKQYL